jgi:hypothetical protein
LASSYQRARLFLVCRFAFFFFGTAHTGTVTRVLAPFPVLCLTSVALCPTLLLAPQFHTPPAACIASAPSADVSKSIRRARATPHLDAYHQLPDVAEPRQNGGLQQGLGYRYTCRRRCRGFKSTEHDFHALPEIGPLECQQWPSQCQAYLSHTVQCSAMQLCMATNSCPEKEVGVLSFLNL